MEEPVLTKVVMLISSGSGPDSQWFDYRPGFFSDIVRVEWDLDTMNVELAANVADYLLRNGYARLDDNSSAVELPPSTEPPVALSRPEPAEAPAVDARPPVSKKSTKEKSR